ncbi:MAG: septum formation protein Maf [Proteobacteria bacterium]|nr:septum formation protein Maf [Pseudomonadota bacterium]MCP4919878.1 septum formation protein Maf [Pseudomonadota bacterium]
MVLASGSPRRRQLLSELGYVLDIRPANIDETPAPGEEPVSYARRLAVEKARACVEDERIVVAADTVVHGGGVLFDKPRDAEDAVRILLALSDRVHTVTTGTCVRRGADERVRTTSTRVRFRALTEGEVRGYVATGEPLDKAGAYGIQGVGGFLVAAIEGSYSNVVGLPLAEVLEDLAALGAPPPFEDR